MGVLHSFPNPKKGCIINLRAAAPAADSEDEARPNAHSAQSEIDVNNAFKIGVRALFLS